MDVGVGWTRIHPFHLQVLGLNTARGWGGAELLPPGSCLGVKWCELVMWDLALGPWFQWRVRLPNPHCLALVGCSHSSPAKCGTRGLLCWKGNVPSLQESPGWAADTLHSRNHEAWCCFGGAVHLHSTRPLSATCSEDGKSQQCHNLSNGCASIKRRTSWKSAQRHF